MPQEPNTEKVTVTNHALTKAQADEEAKVKADADATAAKVKAEEDAKAEAERVAKVAADKAIQDAKDKATAEVMAKAVAERAVAVEEAKVKAAADKIEAARVAEQKLTTDAHAKAVEAQGYQDAHPVGTLGEAAPAPAAPLQVSKRWVTIEDLNGSKERLQVMNVGGGMVLRSVIVDDDGITSQCMIFLASHEVVGPTNIIRHQ